MRRGGSVGGRINRIIAVLPIEGFAGGWTGDLGRGVVVTLRLSRVGDGPSMKVDGRNEKEKYENPDSYYFNRCTHTSPHRVNGALDWIVWNCVHNPPVPPICQ